jgi:FdhD protein
MTVITLPAAMTRPAGASVIRVERRQDGLRIAADDAIAEEVPVAFRFGDVAYAVMLASPLDLEDFAVGFSLAEGIIEHAGQIEAVSVHNDLAGIILDIQLHPARMQCVDSGRRALTANSGCGVCGTRQLEDAIRWPAVVADRTRFDVCVLTRALPELRAAQPLFDATGAVHAAAWFTPAGSFKLLREDVGRHNALDKLIGARARLGYAKDPGFVVVSSRASYEMVQKVAAAGIGMMVAVSAPTTLAVRMAESAGITLVGFAREERFVVYTHAWRLETSDSQAGTSLNHGIQA